MINLSLDRHDFGGGCPGHNIRYFDDDGNEITKEECEKKGGVL